MKSLAFLILAVLLTGCSATPALPTQSPSAEAFQQTKLFVITADVETQIAGYPKNDATVTAVMASKYAGGTEAAGTMTAQPSLTPTPTIPSDSPLCRPGDLKTDFRAMGGSGGSMGLSAGLTNISGRACYLQSWPQVVLTNPQGQPLEINYSYTENGVGNLSTAATQQAQESTTAKFGLPAGRTTWVGMIWQNWCQAPIRGGAVMRLTLMGDAGVIEIPTGLESSGQCEAGNLPSVATIEKIELTVPPQ